MGTVQTPRHWVRGPSQADRIVACPGCVAEQEKYPPDPSGPSAIDGTHSHTLLERCLRQGLPHAGSFLGEVLTDHEGEFRVQADRAERVGLALTYIGNRMLEIPPSAHPRVVVESEVLVDAGASHGIPNWMGTADVILTGGDLLEVIDFKDGFKAVPPTSAQLISYALGAIHRELGRRFARVRLTIIQPKDPRGAIKFQDYTREEFDAAAAPVIAGLLRSTHPDAPLTTGDHCKWCRAGKPGRCPAYNDEVLRTMQDAFANVPAAPGLPGAPISLGIQVPDVASSDFTEEQLSQILDSAPLVRAWLSEVEAEALRRFQVGRFLPRYKVVRGRSVRTWATNNEEELIKKLRNMGFPKEEYIKEVVRTPTQVLAAPSVKGFTERKVTNLESLITKPLGALKVVPESDPGQAVLLSAEQVFAEVVIPEPVPAPPVSESPALSFL